jgi:hypothetical protein
MSRDGAIIFADLIGKLDVLYVHCSKCSRARRSMRRSLPGFAEGASHVRFAPESGHVQCN